MSEAAAVAQTAARAKEAWASMQARHAGAARRSWRERLGNCGGRRDEVEEVVVVEEVVEGDVQARVQATRPPFRMAAVWAPLAGAGHAQGPAADQPT